MEDVVGVARDFREVTDVAIDELEFLYVAEVRVAGGEVAGRAAVDGDLGVESVSGIKDGDQFQEPGSEEAGSAGDEESGVGQRGERFHPV